MATKTTTVEFKAATDQGEKYEQVIGGAEPLVNKLFVPKDAFFPRTTPPQYIEVSLTWSEN